MRPMQTFRYLFAFCSALLPLTLCFAQAPDYAALRQQTQTQFAEGKYAQALESGLALVSQAGTEFGRDDAHVGEALEIMGDLYRRLGKFSDAESWYRKALAHRQTNIGPNAEETGLVFYHLAHLYDESGQLELAENYLKRSITVLENAPGADPSRGSHPRRIRGTSGKSGHESWGSPGREG